MSNTAEMSDGLGRELADEAFSRAAGAPLVRGNQVCLLKDARENYPAWLAAIRAARNHILFENYVIYDDRTGNEFADALIERAHAGVRVRLIYDWMGLIGNDPFSGAFWKRIRAGGVEVRAYNPPRLDSPFAWISRDHRKMLAVDGQIGFVAGLCVGDQWAGDPARGIEPWRDTGVQIQGPAVADVEAAFADLWAALGDPIPAQERTRRETVASAGDCALRVVAGTPNTAGLFRLDQLIASIAQERLWLSDAYYAGTTAYVQALRAAVRSGVDVRLLVPGKTDNALLQPFSRAGYRPLLEAGIRVFEWNGTMMHAKTAVADARWARVGSSNLNLASWLGNYELDVTVEDERFAREMEATYLADLEHATEIVLDARRHVRAPGAPKRPHRIAVRRTGSAGRALSGALRVGNTAGAAITNRRPLGPAEARIMAGLGIALIVLILLAVLFPWVVIAPLSLVGGWVAIALLIKAYELWSRERRS
jgi:cardiolipin synthase A/B